MFEGALGIADPQHNGVTSHLGEGRLPHYVTAEGINAHALGRTVQGIGQRVTVGIAGQWLKDIYEYFALDNPQAAGKVIEEIYLKTKTLKDFPQQGYLFRKDPDSEIRVLLYGHYRIAYQLYSDNTQLDILGVFHGKLDIDRFLS